jgi:hypothetical protein
LGSEDVDWRRRLGEPAPERSFGDREREASEGRIKPRSGVRFAGVWGREPLEALLYGSECALRRRPSGSVSFYCVSHPIIFRYIPLSGGVNASVSKAEGLGPSKPLRPAFGANSTLICGGTICWLSPISMEPPFCWICGMSCICAPYMCCGCANSLFMPSMKEGWPIVGSC